ncbi:DUF3134 family protein [Gloeomargarita sp.]
MPNAEDAALERVAEEPIVIPTLREIPIHEPAGVIPTPANASILNWLESIGRMDAGAVPDYPSLYDEDSEVIDDFTGDDEDLYEDDELGDELGDEEEEDY